MSDSSISSPASELVGAITQQIREMVSASQTGQSGAFQNLFDHCMVWAVMVPEEMVNALRNLSDTMETSAELRQIYADQMQYFGDWPNARVLGGNNPSPALRTWSEASQEAVNLIAIPGSGEDFLASTLMNYMGLVSGEINECRPLDGWVDRIIAGDRFSYHGDGDVGDFSRLLNFPELPYDYFIHHQQCSAAALMGPKRILLFRNPLDSFTAQYQRLTALSLGDKAATVLSEGIPAADIDDINEFVLHFIFTMRCFLMQQDDETEAEPYFLSLEELNHEPFDHLADVIDYLDLEFDADKLDQALDFAIEEAAHPTDGVPAWNLTMDIWKDGLKSTAAFRALETMHGANIDIDHFIFDPIEDPDSA